MFFLSHNINNFLQGAMNVTGTIVYGINKIIMSNAKN